jgi:hypothetical protein
MRKLFVIALLCALSVAAVEFDVTLFPGERSIKANETAVFEIELSHNSPAEELFEVFSNDVTWDIRPEKTLLVPPKGILKTNLMIRPLNLNPGAYNLPINFKRAGSFEQVKKSAYIEIKSQFPDDVEYLPAVRGVASVAKEVDPRQGMKIKLELENQNRRELSQVDVRVRSAVVSKDYSTTLGPLEKKTLTFDVDLNPQTPAQSDALLVSIVVPEQERAYQFDLIPVPFDVVPFGGIVPYVEDNSSFFKNIQTVTLVNEGNRQMVHKYRVPAWFGKRIFVASTPDYFVENGDMVWEVNLGVAEKETVVIVYNYRPLVWLFLLLVLGTIAYFNFRSPVVVMKRATVVGSHEGGITELKVIVELINRGRKVVRHAKVMDMAPRLADVSTYKESVLSPNKITPSEKGTVIRWDIDFMEPREHRILMYRVKTKMEVLGGMTLPVTAVKFSVDGRERETVSSEAVIKYK